jgi:predicted site-specific integrase-resolvase
MDRAKRQGVKLVDVARVLGVSRSALFRFYRLGLFNATLVRDGRYKYLVTPRDDVERLREKLVVFVSTLRSRDE